MSLKYATSIADVSYESVIDLRELAEWLRDYADPELSIIEDEDEKAMVAGEIAEDLELVRGDAGGSGIPQARGRLGVDGRHASGAPRADPHS